MATPLKDKIRAAAIATPALTAILGTNPFRWFDTQLVQGSAFPAVVVQIISDAEVYTMNRRLNGVGGPTRVQYTLWGVNTAAGQTALANLEAALQEFWDGLDLVGVPGLTQYSNHIVGARDGFVALPKPGNMLRLIDVMTFSNASL